MSPTLGYWKIRGLGHAIRMVLHYKEVQFEDKMYEEGDAPDYSKEEWLKEKFTLGLDWPNLPYYVDGDVKLTETSAILAYLGRKYDFGGTTEEAKLCNEVTYSATFSNRLVFVITIYNPDYEKVRGPFVEGLSGRLEQYSKVLGDDEFFGKSEMVYADFCVYDLLDIWNQFEPGCVEKFDNLKAFMARVEALPTLRKFLSSEAGMKKGPFSLKMASWDEKSSWGGYALQ